MKELSGLLMLLCGIVLYGCDGVSKEITAQAIDERSGVFYEAGDEEKPSPEMIGLVVKAQFKTNLEGFYIFESKNSPHGKPAYSFLLDIDGQCIVWQMDGHKEITSYYDAEGKWTIEGGPGMRYNLEKKIRIAPGVHRVFIALPGDNFAKKFEISLNKSELYVLELNPIYLKNSHRRQTYLRGIKDFEIVLSPKPAGKDDSGLHNYDKTG